MFELYLGFSHLSKRQFTSSMENKHIRALPDEVMEIIFLYLSVSDLLTSTLVCKKWDSIISRKGSEIVAKLIPRITCNHPIHGRNIVINFNLTRKYCGLKFDFMVTCLRHDSNEQMCQTISTSLLQESLTKLELFQVKFGASFMESLEKCQKIRFLSFIFCIFETLDTDQIQKAVEFNSLQYLKLYKSSDMILETLKCDKLRQLTIHEEERDSENDKKILANCRCTVKFLNKLKILDELYVKFATDEFIDKLEPKFRLKCLNLSVITSFWSDEYNPYYSNFYNYFLENMIALHNSLNENANVALSIREGWKTTLGKEVLNCFGKIDSLSLSGTWSNVLGVRALHEVRNLTLDIYGNDLINLMLKLPNVEDLTLKNDEFLKPLEKESEFASMLFKNVRKVRITRITKSGKLDSDYIISRIKRIKFPKLAVLFLKQDLEFLKFVNDDDTFDDFLKDDFLKELKSFCRYNATLESLVIKVTAFFDDFFSATCLHKLQFIELKNELGGTSVKSCQIIYEHHREEVVLLSMYEKHTENHYFGTRDEKDLKMFGRILTDEEKSFFSEIILKNKFLISSTSNFGW